MLSVHFACWASLGLVHYLLTCDKFLGALAAKGDSAPAQNDGGAIRALVDTIQNEEV